MNKISLFSGIGGDDIASEACGIKTVVMCEIDKDCRKVLRYHFPGIPIIKDVKDVNYETIGVITNSNSRRLERATQKGRDSNGCDTQRETSRTSIPEFGNTDSKGDLFRGGIDIISGGFPCQPHSVAGKHLGSADERDLWGEFRRIIGEIKPRWVVAENVPGLFSTDAGRFFRGILRDLSEMGYSVGWCTFGAVDVGAWHRRDRVFIIAFATTDGWRSGGHNQGSFLERKFSENFLQSRDRGWCETGRTCGSGRERKSPPELPATPDSQCVGRQAGAGQGIQPEVQEAVGQDFGNICEEGDVPHSSGYGSEAGLSKSAQWQKGDSKEFNDCGVGNTTVKGLQGSIATGGICTERLSAEQDNVSDSQSQSSNGSNGQGCITELREFRGCPCGARASGQFEPGVGLLADGFPRWMAEPDGEGLDIQALRMWQAEPEGVPRVDVNIKARVAKLKALGNAVVPAQVYQVYKAIVEIERTLST